MIEIDNKLDKTDDKSSQFDPKLNLADTKLY